MSVPPANKRSGIIRQLIKRVTHFVCSAGWRFKPDSLGKNEMTQQLRLYEGVMLLALNEVSGTMNGDYIDITVAASGVADLLLMKRIATDSEGYVKVEDASSTDDWVLNRILNKMASASKPRKLKYWVERLGNAGGMKHLVAKSLAEKGIVKAEEKTVLWLFTKRVYPEINPDPENALRSAMRRAVFEPDAPVSEHTTLMLALAKSGGLLKQVFTTGELRQHKARIQQVVEGQMIGKAAKQAIEAIQMVVIMAAVIPTIVVTS